jgi:hypothetical protein
MPLSCAAVPLRDAEVSDFFFPTVAPVAVFEVELLVGRPATAARSTLSVGPELSAGKVDDAVVVSAID